VLVAILMLIGQWLVSLWLLRIMGD
jgi:hypothetical protein